MKVVAAGEGVMNCVVLVSVEGFGSDEVVRKREGNVLCELRRGQ